jgi:hypothetical protein
MPQTTPELAAIVAAILAFLVGLWLWRARTRRTRNVGRKVANGPSNLRFKCAGCSQQFTHSRRTLSAWEKGGRGFYCNACHTKWRGSRTVQPSHGSRPPPHPAASARERSGCLGVVLLAIAVPAAWAVAFAVSRYA